jgi:hypothetical protein
MGMLFAQASARLRCGLLSALLAVLTAAVPARAAGVAPDAASAEDQKRAQRAYDHGVTHFKASRFSEAARAFQVSYGIVASPNSHMMFARALRDAGELGRAYEEMALSQQEASELAVRLPRYAGTAESTEREMRELLKRVAVLSIELAGEAAGEATLLIGERQVPRARWRAVAVEPGSVQVSVRLPGGRQVQESAQAELGSVTSVRIELDRTTDEPEAAPSAAPREEQTTLSESPVEAESAPPSRSLRPWAYVAGAVGVAGFLTFGVVGSMSRSTYSDLEDECPGRVCPPERQEDIDAGKTQQLVANVGLVVGIVGVATGATLFIIDEKRVAQHGAGRGLRVQAGPGSLSLAGSF